MSKNGLVTDGEGWFVVNARESRWFNAGPLGAYCTFEGKRRFPHLGINISVLEPDEAMAMYHRENAQEAFLVLRGACTLIVEDEERTLTAWDFFHCPPGTGHVIVATGDEGAGAVVLAVGARGRRGGRATVYPVCEAAARHGTSVVRETTVLAEAYAGLPRTTSAPYREGSLPDVNGRSTHEKSDAGRIADTDGWFVVNVGDAPWVTSDYFGDACIFEGDDAPFAELGFTLAVLRPGEPGGLYHHETNQEDFLVLAGECLLLVEGEERHLRAWDFVHCPPGTEHAFVGMGNGRCLVFMTGGRIKEKSVVYPHSELARRHGAGAEAETTSSAEAYAPFPRWQPGRPATWDDLPWV